MFGYDWPRLHAALNDLPTALLVTAALFELLALATRREAFRNWPANSIDARPSAARPRSSRGFRRRSTSTTATRCTG